MNRPAAGECCAPPVGGDPSLKKLVDTGLVSVERRHEGVLLDLPEALKELTTWLS